MSGLEVLEELRQLDYELYCRINKSHLSENQWDWLIDNFKLLKNDRKNKHKK